MTLLLSSKDVRVVVVLVLALTISNGSSASIPRERRVGEGWIINGIPMSIDHVAFNRHSAWHTGERPADNRIENTNIEDPALAAGINSNVVFNSKPPTPPLVTESKAPAPHLLMEGSLVEDNVVNLLPPVQSLEKPNESILFLGGGEEVELLDEVEEQPGLRTEEEKQGPIGMVTDIKIDEKLPNLKTETENQGPAGMVTDIKTVEKKPEAVYQGSAEIVSDVKPVEDRGVNTFETEEAVKEETEVTLMKDVKAAVDSNLEASETGTPQQESRSNDVVNVEDDWGDFEEAFGDEQEVAEVEVIGGGENHDDLLHADSDEEVGDGDGLVKSIEMR